MSCAEFGKIPRGVRRAIAQVQPRCGSWVWGLYQTATKVFLAVALSCASLHPPSPYTFPLLNWKKMCLQGRKPNRGSAHMAVEADYGAGRGCQECHQQPVALESSVRGLTFSSAVLLCPEVSLQIVWVSWKSLFRRREPAFHASTFSSDKSRCHHVPSRTRPLTPPVLLQGAGNLHAVGPVPALLQLPHGRQHEEDHPLAQVRHLPLSLGRQSFLS